MVELIAHDLQPIHKIIKEEIGNRGVNLKYPFLTSSKICILSLTNLFLILNFGKLSSGINI